MAGRTNQLRIIGGRHRGRRLSFVPVSGLRPTPDRVRETLFNWLRADVAEARCLDLFAGSGALGLEALSRGASFLFSIEQNRQAAQRLKENLELLGEQRRSEVRQGDVLRLLRQSPEAPFDIVFADPPFADRVLPAVCRLLETHHWLAPDAAIYLEQDARADWPQVPSAWRLMREGDAGQSAQRLLRRNIQDAIIKKP